MPHRLFSLVIMADVVSPSIQHDEEEAFNLSDAVSISDGKAADLGMLQGVRHWIAYTGVCYPKKRAYMAPTPPLDLRTSLL